MTKVTTRSERVELTQILLQQILIIVDLFGPACKCE